MKRTLTGVVLSLLVALTARAQAVKTVASVDLPRYLGTWHEIARLPNSFQKKCTEDVTAEYLARQDGNITVINRCRMQDGSIASATGIAKVVEGSGNAKLKVSFLPGWLTWLPWGWGDYWVVALSPDYTYAVVGDARREYLWILSRQTKMDPATYRTALEQAGAQGYPIRNMIETRHSSSSTDR